MSLLITDAGIAASIRAGELGISYKIAEISIGTEGYTPTADQTTLRHEVQRKAITRGEVAGLGQLHFETMWDGTEIFEGKELGYWLDDGTLFAVDSRDGEVITYKQQDTVVIEACEINLAASTIDNISVELLEAYSATEERSGVAKIARNEDVEEGTDDTRVITIKKLLKRTASTVRNGLVQLSNSYTGNSENKAVTEKALRDGLAKKSGSHDHPYLRDSAKTTLTDNDGYGHANLVFNHKNGMPQQDGSSYRLRAETDLETAKATFEMANNVKGGVLPVMTTIYELTTVYFNSVVPLKEMGQRVFSPNNPPPTETRSWKDMKASRTFGVTYENDTGSDIIIDVQASGIANNSIVYCLTQGRTLSNGAAISSGNNTATGSFTIQRGANFKLTLSGFSSIIAWEEYSQ